MPGRGMRPSCPCPVTRWPLSRAADVFASGLTRHELAHLEHFGFAEERVQRPEVGTQLSRATAPGRGPLPRRGRPRPGPSSSATPTSGPPSCAPSPWKPSSPPRPPRGSTDRHRATSTTSADSPAKGAINAAAADLFRRHGPTGNIHGQRTFDTSPSESPWRAALAHQCRLQTTAAEALDVVGRAWLGVRTYP